MYSQKTVIRDYFLACSEEAMDLTTQVQTKLKEEGWTLLGETFAESDKVFQAMVKLEVVESTGK